MRNWNVLLPLDTLNEFPRFQTTYEELKLIIGDWKNRNNNGFQTTYEELKLKSLELTYDETLGFQTTYEELKLCQRERELFAAEELPDYLWGIETQEDPL